jgi:hypothetical protein
VNPPFGARFPGGATFNIVGPGCFTGVNVRVSNNIEDGTSAVRGSSPHSLSVWPPEHVCAVGSRDEKSEIRNPKSEIGWWGSCFQIIPPQSRRRGIFSARVTRPGGTVDLQSLILNLQRYWADCGCIIQQPYDLEVGAGTMHPESFLRVLGRIV